jgi:hypothetical protein
MADYERSQTVEAPAGALFEFLADVGNLPSRTLSGLHLTGGV